MSARSSRRQGAARSMLVVTFALGAAALVVTACARSDEAPSAPAEAGAPEPLVPGPRDAAIPDAPSEAATRACSDENFCHTPLPGDATLRDVWGDGATVWSVSEEGDVLRWDGASWTVHASSLGALFAVWGTAPTDIWIGGAEGVFHGTGATPEAVAFTPATVPGNPEIPIRSIWGTSASDLYAVGGNQDADFLPRGRVLHWDGATWELDAISAEPLAFTRVWGSAAYGTWIGGDDGTDYSFGARFYRRTAAAEPFELVIVDAHHPSEGPEMGIPGTFSAGGIGADGRLVIVGKTLGFTPSFWFASREGDAGALTWTYEARDLNDPQLRAVWGLPGASTWVAGDYGRLRSRAGEAWSTAAIMIADFPVTRPLYGMWGTQADDFWVVGKDIAMHRKPGAP